MAQAKERLIVTQCFPPVIGGIENLMVGMADWMAGEGAAVRVLADGGGSPLGDRPQAGAYTLQRFGGLKPLRRRFKAWTADALVRRGGVEAVFCDSWKSLERLTATAAPIVCLAHGTEYPPGASAAKTRRIRAALGRASVIAANSHFTAELVRPFTPPGPQIRVVHPPLVPPAPANPRWLAKFKALRGDGLLVTTLCRLEPRKGVDMLIEAYARLRRDRPALKLLIGGDGPDRPRLEALAKAAGLEANVFLGFVGEDKSALLEASDVFAMATRRQGASIESFGMVYTEAAWFGVPSLAGRDGGAADAVLDEETGLLCDGASIDDVARQLARLIDDEALRRRLGEAARRLAEQSTWDRCGPLYLP